MRQQVVRLAAAGSSQWLFLNDREDFNVGLVVTLDSTANLTYDVEITYDRNTSKRHQIATFSSAVNTVTVTLADHGLATGDNVIVFDTGNSDFDGRFDVTVVDDDTFTYTVTGVGSATATGKVLSFRVFDHATLAAETTAQQGVQVIPVAGVRLNITSYTAGSATLTVLQQG